MTGKEKRVLGVEIPFANRTTDAHGEFLEIDGSEYYVIRNYDTIPPFFMNIVSSSNHWMFLSSSGGITAGRIDADHALFPYYTEDKISESFDWTGHKTIFHVTVSDTTYLWEPFSQFYQGIYHLERNLYKSIYGEKILFEEINRDLDLCFRYQWSTSDKYGFVLRCSLESKNTQVVKISLLSGIQNILPWGATSHIQQNLSNLLDAYKRNELDRKAGIGVYSLSAALTDLAEPSESLKASITWQTGLNADTYLLSSSQINNFRSSGIVSEEKEILGERGAYFVHTIFHQKPDEQNNWYFVADVSRDAGQILSLKEEILNSEPHMSGKLERDILKGSENLLRIVAGSDGLQISHEKISSVHHFANVLYNDMRGGTFLNGYTIRKTEFLDYLKAQSKGIEKKYSDYLETLEETFTIQRLIEKADAYNDADLIRHCRQYLPLSFSRRHGDPSRPWNKFSISIKDDQGNVKLDYQGNWRDIFQNWEALAISFPDYIENMIFRFLNATTADGYNPYRIHMKGIDWEVPDPTDPWSNIGYWSDHQIIYLEKFLEMSREYHPNRLKELLDRKLFVHSNVPYRIKEFKDILADPYNTILFDAQENKRIHKIVTRTGYDSQLVRDSHDCILHVSFTEKILILLMAKVSNFIPEGGIWMNTQRPEWNDANNALVGKGLSVVTVSYLRRFVSYLLSLYEESDLENFPITREAFLWFEDLRELLERFKGNLNSSFRDEDRFHFLNDAGMAGDRYRQQIYLHAYAGNFNSLSKDVLSGFLRTIVEYLDHCLRKNKREDGLFHSYNILSYSGNKATIRHLYEMLEGQVAILSSGFLDARESLTVLKALEKSPILRKDQNSYMLYPDRTLPGFLDKNRILPEDLKNSALIDKLVQKGDKSLLYRDLNGDFRFNGNFRNAKDVKACLDSLKKQKSYKNLAAYEEKDIVQLFIKTFRHDEFTGRSGTFFAYEGLGSIYWHMVSKLLLAVQEVVVNSQKSDNTRVPEELIGYYYKIRMGLGFQKTPSLYGAFPADPYSHTPKGKGAKQPGMTGQVKEEILTRQKELGIFVENGCLSFHPLLLRKEEFLQEPQEFSYFTLTNDKTSLLLPKGSLACTICQVPVILHIADKDKIVVEKNDGYSETFENRIIPQDISRMVFDRSGYVKRIDVYLSLEF